MINRTGKSFEIEIRSEQALEVTEGMKFALEPYLLSKADVSISVVNQDWVDYLKSLGQKDWFGYYKMHFEGDVNEMTVGQLQNYQGEGNTYRRILGRGFEPMRRLHDFKPFDWYSENKEASEKEFEEAQEENNFYGYLVDGRIVGCGIVVGDEIDVMAIDPELQKNGLGRQLLRGIVGAMKNKHEKITLGVVESNQHVLKLYLSEGFVVDEHLKMMRNY